LSDKILNISLVCNNFAEKNKMNKFLCFFLFFFCLIHISVFAQENVSDAQLLNNIIQDPAVAGLMTKHIELNEIHPCITGYRVQIFFDSGNNSKDNALKIRTDFMTRFPEVSCYLLWQQPNYKVRVGDFRNRLEAQGFLEKIRNDYKNAFIVKDKIAFPSLEHTD